MVVVVAFVCLSICQSAICKLVNKAILPDFLSFRTWQHQKRSISARLPRLFKLTTSKTKQFCEASFQNRNLNAELTASCQCVLQFFHLICLKYCAGHETVRPGHTKFSTCTRNHLKCNPSEKTSALTGSIVPHLPRERHLRRSSSNVLRLPLFFKVPQKPHALLTPGKVRNPCACHAKRHLNVHKWSVPVISFLHF